ncbi:uncharacterized protein [Gossypium hirsutum]|uniref:Uncharacterized protein n=1 Tax=Gossypium hirsutum TaxID=3635 RepID=A0A1U8P4F8_GOSHI|nr:uncharacterized protein LOC107954809 [Gossypium hirsutum]
MEPNWFYYRVAYWGMVYGAISSDCVFCYLSGAICGSFLGSHGVSYPMLIVIPTLIVMKLLAFSMGNNNKNKLFGGFIMVVFEVMGMIDVVLVHREHICLLTSWEEGVE